jgi:hypothetical protein
MVEDTRKGFLTPEQEKQVDVLIKASGIVEALDGPAITLGDNQGLERLKGKLIEKWPDALPVIYEVIDEVFSLLPTEKKQ